MGIVTSITTTPAIDVFTQERDTDLLIIRKIQAGDIHAFDTLVDRYKNRLFVTIYNMTGNRENAADLLQDVFIKAFQNLGRFKGSASFSTWIYRIALNTTVGHLRRQKLRRFLSFETVDESAVNPAIIEALIDKTQAADKDTLLSELQLKLNEALQSLSVKHRTTLILAEVEGLSSTEISEIMKCNEGTVRSRLHYAKQTLQHLLKPYLS